MNTNKFQTKTGVTFILIRSSGKMLLQHRDDGGGKKFYTQTSGVSLEAEKKKMKHI